MEHKIICGENTIRIMDENLKCKVGDQFYYKNIFRTYQNKEPEFVRYFNPIDNRSIKQIFGPGYCEKGVYKITNKIVRKIV
jgi:hypothetical protein